MGPYVFPKWTNALLPTLIVLAMLVPPYLIYVVAYGFSPKTTDVGYQPVQPIPFSHELHAGQLGMDCRYCHNTVEYTARASIPPTQTCMNCHTQIQKDSPKLEPLRESYRTGMPLGWVRIHDLPDYAYFNHAAHVTRGVSCVECHGRIDKMETVYQFETLAMGWCLECHRAPDASLRNPQDVTKLWMYWGEDPEARVERGAFWRDENHLNPSQDCSVCHR